MDEDTTWFGLDLGAGHIVLDGFPALRKRGTAPPPPFRPMSIMAIGHGRPTPISATAELLLVRLSLYDFSILNTLRILDGDVCCVQFLNFSISEGCHLCRRGLIDNQLTIVSCIDVPCNVTSH